MLHKHINYMAGFFDGEGCIYINKQKKNNKYLPYHHRYQGVITVCNTKKEPLRLFSKYFGGKIRIQKEAKNTHPKYVWRIVSKQAFYFCETMRNYLLIKRKQAKLLIRLQKTMGPSGKKILSNKFSKQREALYLDIKKLNKTSEVT